MVQKYGAMANTATAARKEDWSCEVCGGQQGFNWSDLHGEGMCNQCGTPYQLKGEEIDSPRLNIRADWLPTLRRYWNETHTYMGLGQIIIWRDYPEAEKGRRALNEWLEAHPDAIPPEPKE